MSRDMSSMSNEHNKWILIFETDQSLINRVAWETQWLIVFLSNDRFLVSDSVCCFLISRKMYQYPLLQGERDDSTICFSSSIEGIPMRSSQTTKPAYLSCKCHCLPIDRLLSEQCQHNCSSISTAVPLFSCQCSIFGDGRRRRRRRSSKVYKNAVQWSRGRIEKAESDSPLRKWNSFFLSCFRPSSLPNTSRIKVCTTKSSVVFLTVASKRPLSEGKLLIEKIKWFRTLSHCPSMSRWDWWWTQK